MGAMGAKRVYPDAPVDTDGTIFTIYPGTPWFPIDNMWPCEISAVMPLRLITADVGDRVFQTARSSEHIFQAEKATHAESWLWVMAAGDGYEAKRRGRMVELRADWEAVKYDAMVAAVRAKIGQCPVARRVLLSTGDRRIEEGNWWEDRIWGVCPPGSGDGDNWLGEVLMAERARWQS